MAHKEVRNHTPDAVVLRELGLRLARHRLAQDLSQGALAHEAGISRRTLVRLESGQSTQTTNLLRVLRALGLLGNLERLVPAPRASPLAQLERAERERRRASRRVRRSARGPKDVA